MRSDCVLAGDASSDGDRARIPRGIRPTRLFVGLKEARRDTDVRSRRIGPEASPRPSARRFDHWGRRYRHCPIRWAAWHASAARRVQIDAVNRLETTTPGLLPVFEFQATRFGSVGTSASVRRSLRREAAVSMGTRSDRERLCMRSQRHFAALPPARCCPGPRICVPISASRIAPGDQGGDANLPFRGLVGLRGRELHVIYMLDPASQGNCRSPPPSERRSPARWDGAPQRGAGVGTEK